jgi:hypothetical protein
MSPKCCKECGRENATGSCSQYTHCPRWRDWFRAEWEGIRRDVAYIKLKKKTLKIKAEAGNGKN